MPKKKATQKKPLAKKKPVPHRRSAHVSEEFGADDIYIDPIDDDEIGAERPASKPSGAGGRIRITVASLEIEGAPETIAAALRGVSQLLNPKG